jgi:pimeloyl-ACP methyl ester carboxylesterase
MAAGIRDAFGEQICYSYYDGSAESALDMAQDLSTYVSENGPFDAVMGFSLGAALAATLLLGDAAVHSMREVGNKSISDSDASPRHSLIFRCAVFLSGTLPCDWNELTRGNLSFLHASDVKHPIQIPTLHAWSPADVEYPHQSEELAEMCVSQRRTVVLHNDGHAPPTHQESIHSTAKAIREMVANLSWEPKR